MVATRMVHAACRPPRLQFGTRRHAAARNLRGRAASSCKALPVTFMRCGIVQRPSPATIEQRMLDRPRQLQCRSALCSNVREHGHQQLRFMHTLALAEARRH